MLFKQSVAPMVVYIQLTLGISKCNWVLGWYDLFNPHTEGEFLCQWGHIGLERNEAVTIITELETCGCILRSSNR